MFRSLLIISCKNLHTTFAKTPAVSPEQPYARWNSTAGRGTSANWKISSNVPWFSPTDQRLNFQIFQPPSILECRSR